MPTPVTYAPAVREDGAPVLLAELYRSEPAFTVAGLVALGLMLPTGMASVSPNRLVRRSRLDTSRSTRWRSAIA